MMIDLNRACELCCYLCAEGNTPRLDSYTDRYYHTDQYGQFYNTGWCRADRLRKEAKCELELFSANGG